MPGTTYGESTGEWGDEVDEEEDEDDEDDDEDIALRKAGDMGEFGCGCCCCMRMRNCLSSLGIDGSPTT
jgi:hypothetical protein